MLFGPPHPFLVLQIDVFKLNLYSLSVMVVQLVQIITERLVRKRLVFVAQISSEFVPYKKQLGHQQLVDSGTALV